MQYDEKGMERHTEEKQQLSVGEAHVNSTWTNATKYSRHTYA
jgi:hypothetical protein